MTIDAMLSVLCEKFPHRKMATAYGYVCTRCGEMSYRIDRTPTRGRFCSHSCMSLWIHETKRDARGYPGWRSPEGYIRIKRGGKCFLLHREIMEKHVGRKLADWEEVHHRNGDKSDNRIRNLMVVSHTAHWHQIRCPKCTFKFKVK